MENKESFEYTYSAPEQEEVRKIRDKYLPREERENKLEQLSRLDRSVIAKGNMYAIILGVISSLVMGVGMCCCMVWTHLFAIGIVVGLVGMVGIALAYPLYKHIIQRERERIAPEILRLADELMQ